MTFEFEKTNAHLILVFRVFFFANDFEIRTIFCQKHHLFFKLALAYRNKKNEQKNVLNKICCLMQPAMSMSLIKLPWYV